MNEKLWWQEPQRYIQYNMQEEDAEKIIADCLAAETVQMHATAAVINAGGICAWYPSQVSHHRMGRYMDPKRDYLGELVEAFHRKGIRVIARFSFGMMEDAAYMESPHWAMRGPDKKAHIIGGERPGNWNLLYATCQNGHYLDEFCIPVIREVLRKYPIDGVFFNGGSVYPCWCTTCRKEYESLYGKKMPSDMTQLDFRWNGYKSKKISDIFTKAIHEAAPDVPLIGSFQPFAHKSGVSSFTIPEGDLKRDIARNDLVSTEIQDTFSNGKENAPQWNFPTLKMKVGSGNDKDLAPIGIVHTCPGLDWRHIGIPKAEFTFWSLQVPMNRGQLWFSMTGIPDTQYDPRIIQKIEEIFRETKVIQRELQQAKSVASILLVTNGSDDAPFWGSMLSEYGIPYDMCAQSYFCADKLSQYPVLIIPNGFKLQDGRAEILKQYCENGGSVLIEASAYENAREIKEEIGVVDFLDEGESLEAAYLRLESESLLRQFQGTQLLPFQGEVLYCLAEKQAEVPVTLVPPFAPKQVTGAPPERASLPIKNTKIPMCIRSSNKSINTVFLPFSAAKLAVRSGLPDLSKLLFMQIKDLLCRPFDVEILPSSGSIMTGLSQDEKGTILSLINASGSRPLKEEIPVSHNVELLVYWNQRAPKRVYSSLNEAELKWELRGDQIWIRIPQLRAFELIRIDQ